ncbi:hypothetical protein K439DRAFT_1362540 [Ramaria rubella]|nr:hypothetical protein K439DRAFT_1368359 [Ramaria rubella]KAF8578255.1 hypothetical protein K439DRAFT_1362540 [Ramaria rubella]
MSLPTTNDSSSKADQIAHKFFSKFALLLHHARAIPHLPQSRVDKWFNLETPDTDQFRDHLRLYRTLSSSSSSLPPFELQVLLSVPELATNQVLVLSDATATRARVDPTPSHVLLESWVVVFNPGRTYDDDRPDIALSSVYKQSISVFRSMFTLLRVLPAWRLFRKLRRPESSSLAIQVRVANSTNGDRMLGFGTWLLCILTRVLMVISRHPAFHICFPFTHIKPRVSTRSAPAWDTQHQYNFSTFSTLPHRHPRITPFFRLSLSGRRIFHAHPCSTPAELRQRLSYARQPSTLPTRAQLRRPLRPTCASSAAARPSCRASRACR